MANNVIKFPGTHVAQEAENAPAAGPTTSVKKSLASILKKTMDNALTALWFVVVLCWPVLRWVLGLDVALRFALMCWHWDDSSSHAGWTFVLHFAVLVALTAFVSAFKPQSVK
ncbi:KleE stable inheritance protein [Pseudomonas syringae]|uniref:KleE stable inheritance protein n=1 Tax=Pseudomonas syringae TaxID=317 RepID=UPI00200B3E22|nr:KleE stable inheritance protein [Pseudomonas syringae]MCK9709846.1 protein kleE [Pseudomonas syringae pv. syringae]